MSEKPVKAYPTIGCCGLDCGLCPRYYTVGSSRCPGCCGPDFYNKHPSCGYITCCVKKKNLLVCAQCDEFPCSKFEPWLEKCEEQDSFVTYRNVKSNLYSIRDDGIQDFIEQQKRRIGVLERMIKNFDDGRSKNYYCLAAALLPIGDLEGALVRAGQNSKLGTIDIDDMKRKSKILRELLDKLAAENHIELKLKKKGS